MLSVDTNILVYAVDLDATENHHVAKQLLTDLAATGNAALSEQVLFEFLNVSLGKRRRPLDQVAESIAKWIAVLPVIRSNDDVLTDTLALLVRYRLSTWDARLIATCATHDCDVLFSEDMQDGANYNGVMVVNPFNDANAGLVSKALSS